MAISTRVATTLTKLIVAVLGGSLLLTLSFIYTQEVAKNSITSPFFAVFFFSFLPSSKLYGFFFIQAKYSRMRNIYSSSVHHMMNILGMRLTSES